MDPLRHYREVWAVDFEFTAPPGFRPTPLCMVAREIRSGRVVRVWFDGSAPSAPPFGTGQDVLFVAYYASAEIGCYLALGWPMPARVLDLYAEFRCRCGGQPPTSGYGLLGALGYHGLPSIEAAEKESMRELAMRGGPYTLDEQRQLLDYCQTDVDALAQLLPVMLPWIDLPRALLRGRYMIATAKMEWNGVPIDTENLILLQDNWDRIKSGLIQRVNREYDVWIPADASDLNGRYSFSSAAFERYLNKNGIPWPQLESGTLALDDDTFRDMAKIYPEQIGPIRELRHTLGQMRLNELAVGPDGRNRLILSAFASKTGRNQPSNSKFIFGPSCWLRSLIKPEPGRAVAYVDWSQQELAIAAALSKDTRMMDAYRSGDFYLTFAKMAGAVPADATKKTHGTVRDQFKIVALGVLFGLSAEGLARKLGIPSERGRQLLRMHRETFPVFWAWSQSIQDAAMLTGESRTVFGWTVRVGPNTTPNSLRNFPMQANGAEMMRLAGCLAIERGIHVCCPVHDAYLIEASADDIDAETVRMQDAMREASELVLPGFPLRTDAKIVRYPDRYADPRGERMWAAIQDLLKAG